MAAAGRGPQAACLWELTLTPREICYQLASEANEAPNPPPRPSPREFGKRFWLQQGLLVSGRRAPTFLSHHIAPSRFPQELLPGARSAVGSVTRRRTS